MARVYRCAWLIVIAALTLVVGSTANQLARGNAVALETESLKLPSAPQQFGDWEMQSSHELSALEVDMLQCAANIHRSYKNRVTGQIVNMYIIVGPPGPTSVHNPEICYSSKGYQPAQQAERIEIQRDGKSHHSLWRVTLQSASPTGDNLVVAYSWNAGDGWVAADHPRFSFGGKPYLYKLQLATSVNEETGTDDDACHGFLRDLLPSLDKALFADAPK